MQSCVVSAGGLDCGNCTFNPDLKCDSKTVQDREGINRHTCLMGCLYCRYVGSRQQIIGEKTDNSIDSITKNRTSSKKKGTAFSLIGRQQHLFFRFRAEWLHIQLFKHSIALINRASVESREYVHICIVCIIAVIISQAGKSQCLLGFVKSQFQANCHRRVGRNLEFMILINTGIIHWSEKRPALKNTCVPMSRIHIFAHPL